MMPARGIGKLRSSSIIVNWTLPSPGGMSTGTRLSLVTMVFGDGPFVNHREAHRQLDLPRAAGRTQDDAALHAHPHRHGRAVELALARGLADADLVAQVHRGVFGRVRRDAQRGGAGPDADARDTRNRLVGRVPTRRLAVVVVAELKKAENDRRRRGEHGRRAARQSGAEHDGRRHRQATPCPDLTHPHPTHAQRLGPQWLMAGKWPVCIAGRPWQPQGSQGSQPPADLRDWDRSAPARTAGGPARCR